MGTVYVPNEWFIQVQLQALEIGLSFALPWDNDVK